MAVAVVLADVEPGHAAPRTITITVKAMPEGFLSTHLVGGLAPGTIVRLAAPQGNFVMPDPAPTSVLFLTGRLRHHPGDVDAAHLDPPRSDHRRRHICIRAPTESDVMFAVGAGRAGAGPRPGYRLPVRTTRTAGPARSAPARRRGARLAAAADLGLRPGRHAQPTPRRVWAAAGIERAAAPGTVRGVPGGPARAGRHGDVRAQRQDGRRRRRDVADGRRRDRPACRCPSAAGWGSVSRAWSAWSTATFVTCVPVSSTSRVPAFRPAFRRLPAIACWTSNIYPLVTYGFVGYGSVGTRKGDNDGYYRRSGVRSSD